MKAAVATAAALALSLALGGVASASPAAAPTAVFTQTQLRGHLPDLGQTPGLKVFQTAAEYDAFHKALGDADIFPPASALFTNFTRDVLALYWRGADVGGRCLTTAGSSAVSGGAVTLNLAWQDGTCGAPSNARYPFVLASLSRTANDGSAWLPQLQSVCAAAPGVDGSRACATITGGGTTTASPSATASAKPSTPGATPTPASKTAAPTIAVSDPPIETPSGTITLLGWLGFGLVFGVFIAALFTRVRRVGRTAKLQQ